MVFIISAFVLGLVGKKNQRKEQVALKVLEVLSTYVELIMTQLSPERGRIELLIHHYQEKIPVCVDYCIAVDKKYECIIFSNVGIIFTNAYRVHRKVLRKP